jgi:hypothetical protein
LISVSNVQEKDGRLQAAVEHIDQISKHDIEAVKTSLDVEWKTTLTNIDANSLDRFESPTKPEYWTAPPRKVARLSSDPKTPQR